MALIGLGFLIEEIIYGALITTFTLNLNTT
jgi:hypothetical protein